LVECQLPKLDVAGSNPVSRSIFSIIYSPLVAACSVCAPFIINATLRVLEKHDYPSLFECSVTNCELDHCALITKSGRTA
jgi:hypothetical protein